MRTGSQGGERREKREIAHLGVCFAVIERRVWVFVVVCLLLCGE